MDNFLFNTIYDLSPRFNKSVAEGVAVREAEGVERHVDHLWKCAQESFPPGMTYDGPRRCTPKAEYLAVTKKRNNMQAFELARSDVYMCEYAFSLHGQPLESAKLALPFVGPATETYVRGSCFYVHAVLADPFISVGVNDLFIPFNRDKLTFTRLSAHFMIDGAVETSYVYWSDIHHNMKKDNKSDKNTKVLKVMKSPLFLYMFCKFGVYETFRRMGVYDITIGEYDQLLQHKKEYKLCHTTGYKPTTIKERFYTPTNIALLIHESELTPLVHSLIATFFYIVDYFSDRVTVADMSDTVQWKILLGQIVFKNKNNLGKLLESIDTHMASVEGYMDHMAREQLTEIGVNASDIYELFIYIAQNFSSLLISTDIASMYGKRLTVLRYLLFDITREISKLVFKLQSLPPHKQRAQDINQIIRRSLKMDRILEISGSGHGEVSSVSYPGDSKMFKITGSVILQEAANGVGSKKKNASLDDPSRFLNSSLAAAGSLTNLPKSEPTSRTRANPCVALKPDGTIYQEEECAALLDELQSKISRR